MKRCIIIPDSFKGTMSSIEVCEIVSDVIKKKYPDCETISIPVSDGGEGLVDCFLYALGGNKQTVRVHGPFGEMIDSFYGQIGDTAVIEMAAAAGLPLAKGRLNPMLASTYGVGELICDAVEKGYKKIVLGLGGSCTNDAGAGMAAAVGTKFYDSDGNEFVPTGGSLSEISRIDNSVTKARLKDVSITAMCDIRNPLYGNNGAAYVYAPQKGASPEDVKVLDDNLRAVSAAVNAEMGIDVSAIPGGGAAGGMGAGVAAFLNGELKSGIDTVLEIVGFEEMLKDCDLVITGEGKVDYQSFHGKVVGGISMIAKKAGVPIITVCGIVDSLNQHDCSEYGLQSVITVYDKPVDISLIQNTCKKDLHDRLMTSISA